MKRTLLKFSAILLVTIAFLSSCKKDKYGNADLNHSTNINLYSWTTDFLDAYNFTYYAYATWDKITQETIDEGAVLVYGNVEGEWRALPFSAGGTSATQLNMYYNYSYSYSYSLGKVKVIFDGFDDSGSPIESEVPDLPIRIVTLSAHQIKTHPNVDFQNYIEVENEFNL